MQLSMAPRIQRSHAFDEAVRPPLAPKIDFHNAPASVAVGPLPLSPSKETVLDAETWGCSIEELCVVHATPTWEGAPRREFFAPLAAPHTADTLFAHMLEYLSRKYERAVRVTYVQRDATGGKTAVALETPAALLAALGECVARAAATSAGDGRRRAPRMCVL